MHGLVRRGLLLKPCPGRRERDTNGYTAPRRGLISKPVHASRDTRRSARSCVLNGRSSACERWCSSSPAPSWHWSSGSPRSEEHTSELQSPYDLVCRLLLEKKKTQATVSAPAQHVLNECR